MYIDDSLISYEEGLTFKLRALFQNSGFTRYKMTRFEEYDLYAANKDYLVSDNVISFTDTNGKLMALKPDVTLSLVRNYPIPETGTARLFYSESVYRVSNRTGAFSEITQVGAECLGQVDADCIAATLELAAKSLGEISGTYKLVVTDLDIVTTAIDALALPAAALPQIMRYMENKNIHELERYCAGLGANAQALQQFVELLTLDGTTQEALAWLEAHNVAQAKTSPLASIVERFTAANLASTIRIDFCLASDTAYYNGIAFKGYLMGVPSAVLSGGQYNNLMRRLGKKQDAIGFAVYTDALAASPLAQQKGGE